MIAIADALVAGGSIAVDGLGVFHLRERGPRGGGTGVLFTLAPEMRHALAGNLEAPAPSPTVTRATSLGLDATRLVEEIREAMLAKLPWHHPDLGTFRHVTTTPKTFSDPRTGEVLDIAPRSALAFEPSKALTARLADLRAQRPKR